MASIMGVVLTVRTRCRMLSTYIRVPSIIHVHGERKGAPQQKEKQLMRSSSWWKLIRSSHRKSHSSFGKAPQCLPFVDCQQRLLHTSLIFRDSQNKNQSERDETEQKRTFPKKRPEKVKLPPRIVLKADKNIQLCDKEGQLIKEIAFKHAQREAAEQGLRLVQYVDKNDVKNKAKYVMVTPEEAQGWWKVKKEIQTELQQDITKIKQIRMKGNIEKKDLDSKMEHIIKFLQKGMEVEVSININKKSNQSNLTRLAETIMAAAKGIAKIEKQEGERNVKLILKPLEKLDT
ncbi:uncharacterized protein LOC106165839 [Lingula anatina]|uniref:Uncharacterized protein LOC106165839 n=1 Tax=Lingula anatina TaxID=7574 RepID=A0A1S3IQ42_LINAN|nr:uncharacterized protein LOC106165839 [Lingula anatina]|eukprot:XP_013399654.1 uncharacterized protein LOC106165839 [Lingula anatina]